MNRRTLTSISCLAFVFCVVGCAPEDHVIASKLRTAGSAGMPMQTSFGGANQGGSALGGATNPTIGGSTLGTGGNVNPSFGGSTLGAGGNVNPSFGGSTLGAGGNSNPATGGAVNATCSSFANTKGGHGIEVTIKNARSTPVYLGNRVDQCFVDDSLRVYDANGTKLASDTVGHCTCADLMQYGACPAWSCSRPLLRRLDPGASITVTWNRTLLVDKTLPAACRATLTADMACQQLVPAPAGRYRFVATGSTAWTCATGWDPNVCSCMETNSCEAYTGGAVQGTGDLLEPSLEFDPASTEAVTLTFTEDLGTIPTKNGVPIGDCREPTTAQQTALGCPTTAPAPMSACAAPIGTICRYDIDTSLGYIAYQNVFGCDSEGSWGPGASQLCGQTCSYSGSTVIDLDSANCSSRTLTRCIDAMNRQYAYPPPAQTLLNDYLHDALNTCLGGTFLGFVTLDVKSGCAKRLTTDRSLAPEQSACLKQRFESVRLDCAQQVLCSSFGVALT